MVANQLKLNYTPFLGMIKILLYQFLDRINHMDITVTVTVTITEYPLVNSSLRPNRKSFLYFPPFIFLLQKDMSTNRVQKLPSRHVYDIVYSVTNILWSIYINIGYLGKIKMTSSEYAGKVGDFSHEQYRSATLMSLSCVIPQGMVTRAPIFNFRNRTVA